MDPAVNDAPDTHPQAAYQTLLDQGLFCLHTCIDCGRAHYPPRVLCPSCGSTACRWRTAAGTGTVYSASTVAPRDGEPYSVVLVDLDDGPRVMSNLVGLPPDDVTIGMPVRVRVGVRGELAVPLFERRSS